MPVEAVEISPPAEPCTRGVVVRHGNFAPADFFYWIARHDAAQRFGDQLPAEAVSQQRNIPRHSLADQRQYRRYPRQFVVDAHRTAHEYQSRVSGGAVRHGIARIDGDQLPRYLPFVEKFGEVTGAFGGCVAEDGDGFHIL